MTIPWFGIVLGTTVASQAWELYLEYRQLRALSRYLKAPKNVQAESEAEAEAEAGSGAKADSKAKVKKGDAGNAGDAGSTRDGGDEGDMEKLKKKEVLFPKELEGLTTKEKFLDSLNYQIDGKAFTLLREGVTSTFALLLLCSGFWPLLLRYTNSWLDRGSLLSQVIPSIANHRNGQLLPALLFFVSTTLVSDLLSLPFALYGTFVIEDRHGFNRTTLGLFFSDRLKMTGLSLAIGMPMMLALIKLTLWGGPYCFVYMWLLGAAAIIVFQQLMPLLIWPLFNKFEPIKNPVLRRKIEELAASVDFPLTRLYQYDSSKRDSHSNAFCYGFHKSKRIAMTDTLARHAAGGDTLVVEAVIAHELGHWRGRHPLKLLVLGLVQLFLMLSCLQLFVLNRDVYKAFGFPHDGKEPFICAGFFLFTIVYEPFMSLLSGPLNALSRKFEKEADSYAASLGFAQGLIKSFVALGDNDKGWNPKPDSLYAYWNLSHPTLLERILFLRSVDKKKE